MYNENSLGAALQCAPGELTVQSSARLAAVSALSSQAPCWEGTRLLSVFFPVVNCFAPAWAGDRRVLQDHPVPGWFSARGKAGEFEQSF